MIGIMEVVSGLRSTKIMSLDLMNSMVRHTIPMVEEDVWSWERTINLEMEVHD